MREIVTMSPVTVRSVQRGMNKVVHADGGTANGSDIKNFPVAGKTGTAEVAGRTSHAWFAGFAPYDKPQIAFVVILEYGGRGSEVSAPIAAQFMPEALAAVQPPQKAKKDETTDEHR
jgi:cell division protein FtsI/penicillin-binding protein 2